MLKLNTIIFLLVLLLQNSTLPQQDRKTYKNNINYKIQIELFKLNKIEQADIVMFGDSRIHGANWNELLGRLSVVEQGIVSDVLPGYVARIRYVYKLNPKIVFIIGGLNDIYNWTPVESIFEDYVKICNGLKAKGIIPVLHSTPYAGKNWGKEYLIVTHPELKPEKVNQERNKQVDKLNALLAKYAKENKIDFIDLCAKTKRGKFLKSEITFDGGHFNAKGYSLWTPEVNRVLNKYGL